MKKEPGVYKPGFLICFTCAKIHSMTLYESGENYLETILVLTERNGRVRSVDVASELEYSKPSVSRAIGILKKENLIEVDDLGLIKLTDTGKKRAAAVFDRHNVIARYLNEALGVDKKTSEDDACRIEHIISEKTYEKMKEKLAANNKQNSWIQQQKE